MAFTPYAAATACIPVLLALTLRAWIVSGVALAAGLALALAVLPRAIDGPHVAGPRDPGRRLVVMTSNQLVGHGDARTIVRLVREHHVDVLSLQELTPEAVTRLDAAGIRRLLPGRALIAELVLPT